MSTDNVKMLELLKEFVEETVNLIVDRPDDIQVFVNLSTKAVVIQIKTAKEDCGKVIGKKGHTIEAIKTLLVAIKNTSYPGDPRVVMVEILEDVNSDFKVKK